MMLWRAPRAQHPPLLCTLMFRKGSQWWVWAFKCLSLGPINHPARNPQVNPLLRMSPPIPLCPMIGNLKKVARAQEKNVQNFNMQAQEYLWALGFIEERGVLLFVVFLPVVVCFLWCISFSHSSCFYPKKKNLKKFWGGGGGQSPLRPQCGSATDTGKYQRNERNE